jgi:hypothetical protein
MEDRPKPTQKELRARRLQAALRENLKRRKAQARGRGSAAEAEAESSAAAQSGDEKPVAKDES